MVQRNTSVVRWADAAAVMRLALVTTFCLKHVGLRSGFAFLWQTRQRTQLSLVFKRLGLLRTSRHCDCYHFGKRLMSASHPVNDLRHFQKHSRLHFIGEWKTKQACEILSSLYERHPEYLHHPLVSQELVAHFDMDAFFCSAVLSLPQYRRYRDAPVGIAACGSRVGEGVSVEGSGVGAGRGWSDISSCNYVARAQGVKAGMRVGDAIARCASLVVLPHQLELYEERMRAVYRAVLELLPPTLGGVLEVYSIDDMVMGFDTGDMGLVVEYCERVREVVRDVTCGCTVSCGVAPNILVARLANGRAKPDGLLAVSAAEVGGFIAEVGVGELHGVGDVALGKLERQYERCFGRAGLSSRGFSEGIDGGAGCMLTCGQLQRLTKAGLREALGRKHAETVFLFCRGRDGRMVTPTAVGCGVVGEAGATVGAPKAVGCSLNYAVRLSTAEELRALMGQLVEAVAAKLRRYRVGTLTVRTTLLQRHRDAPLEPPKFMGCGRCEEISHTVRFEDARDAPNGEDVDFLQQLLWERNRDALLCSLRSVTDVRGIGVQACRLRPITQAVAPRVRKAEDGLRLGFARGALRGLWGKAGCSGEGNAVMSRRSDEAMFKRAREELGVDAALCGDGGRRPDRGGGRVGAQRAGRVREAVEVIEDEATLPDVSIGSVSGGVGKRGEGAADGGAVESRGGTVTTAASDALWSGGERWLDTGGVEERGRYERDAVLQKLESVLEAAQGDLPGRVAEDGAAPATTGDGFGALESRVGWAVDRAVREALRADDMEGVCWITRLLWVEMPHVADAVQRRVVEPRCHEWLRHHGYAGAQAVLMI